MNRTRLLQLQHAELQLGLPKLVIDHSRGICTLGDASDDAELEALRTIKVEFDEAACQWGGGRLHTDSRAHTHSIFYSVCVYVCYAIMLVLLLLGFLLSLCSC